MRGTVSRMLVGLNGRVALDVTAVAVLMRLNHFRIFRRMAPDTSAYVRGVICRRFTSLIHIRKRTDLLLRRPSISTSSGIISEIHRRWLMSIPNSLCFGFNDFCLGDPAKLWGRRHFRALWTDRVMYIDLTA